MRKGIAAGAGLGGGEGAGIGSSGAVIGEDVIDEISGRPSQPRLQMMIASLEQQINQLLDQIRVLEDNAKKAREKADKSLQTRNLAVRYWMCR
ncbi:MAG: hypothetical protein OEY94_06465 [Alphaproteobacteria bacterium]|nr:hypothetical protein [Alphaproteobacteria bacterium]